MCLKNTNPCIVSDRALISLAREAINEHNRNHQNDNGDNPEIAFF